MCSNKIGGNKIIIIFTDIDRTLLDEKYEYRGIDKEIRELLLLGSQIIPVTSKTFSELLDYIYVLGFKNHVGKTILAPEDGAVVYHTPNTLSLPGRPYKGFIKSPLSTPLKQLKEKIRDLIPGECERQIVLFSEAEPQIIARITGLPLEKAEKASQREFVEIAYAENPYCKKRFYKNLIKKGLDVQWTWKYLHIGKSFGKAKAVKIIKEAIPYRFESICMGDSESDIQFLEHCEHPIVVRRKEGHISLKRTMYYVTPYPAPAGFRWAVEKIILPLYQKIRRASLSYLTRESCTVS